ncbi:uncharacterized protein TRIADDRAFT_26634 [Trichoplax adhaerens]|uniref:Uncharacterized protein n=1 Tax=Trichoplax adhaerens TaxID=10228 RepID=B3S0D0_TRIAD|nr:hypothetical protein TRIADDRAFT_26634 [Trichoplax adhaerens]EDV23994.1 hypothetical protein TRIADDRAFT_26634 [Trichoplax adhaerens]|eukprot:XP_002113520.1 hypothetical protein TRIADDRAFT_26634 [Trichoplax adhaerens]
MPSNNNIVKKGPLNIPPSYQSDTSNDTNVVNRLPNKVNAVYSEHKKCVNCIRWNPNQHNLLLSASMDGTIRVWNYPQCKESLLCIRNHFQAVRSALWSIDGTSILSGGFDKTLRLTDVNAGKETLLIQSNQFITALHFHPVDNNLFISGGSQGAINCWDIRSGKAIRNYIGTFGQLQDFAFLNGGSEFFSATDTVRRNSTDRALLAWDFKTGAILSNQIYQEAFTCTCLKVHPFESTLIAQSNGNYIAIFSTKRPYKLNKKKRYEGHQVSAHRIGCDFSPDGTMVITGSSDGNFYGYSYKSSNIIKKVEAYTCACVDVAFNPALYRTVATCGWDGNIKILS